MSRECTVLKESDSLDLAFEKMQQSACSTLPVVRDGQLVGLLTLENVGEWVMVRSALSESGERRS
jgi:predicted transcriptional regulator